MRYCDQVCLLATGHFLLPEPGASWLEGNCVVLMPLQVHFEALLSVNIGSDLFEIWLNAMYPYFVRVRPVPQIHFHINWYGQLFPFTKCFRCGSQRQRLWASQELLQRYYNASSRVFLYQPAFIIILSIIPGHHMMKKRPNRANSVPEPKTQTFCWVTPQQRQHIATSMFEMPSAKANVS